MSIFKKPNKNLLELLGPSFLLVALSLSGGELLLWPDLISKYGLGILIFLPFTLIFQASVNLEIARFSLTTNENALNGIFNLLKWSRWVFLVAILLSLVWPAWGLPAGNLIAILIGKPELGSWFAILIMLVLILVWYSKKTYILLESLSKLGLFFALIVSCIVIVYSFKELSNITEINPVFNIQIEDRFLFMSAIAYAGVSGVLNFVQGDWLIDKGYGDKNVKNTDWRNMVSIFDWRLWWKLVVKEHIIVYILGNILGISILSLLAFVTLYNKNYHGFDILIYQISYFNQIQPWLGNIWGSSLVILFSMAQMTILDAGGKLLFHTIPVKKFNSATLSQLLGIAGIIILGLIVIFNIKQPTLLLQISASFSAVFMIFYPPVLLYLNLKLPKGTRPKLNSILIIGCTIFYAIIVLYSLFNFHFL
jgi:hypothetical protein